MVEVYLLKLTDRLDEPAEKFLHLFTEERREKILRYKFAADRNRTIFAELLVRSVIAKKISRPIEEILIERDFCGKPHVVDGNLEISLAHSENWAVCSVGEVPSGVDVEEDFSDALAVAKNFFLPQEYQKLCELDGRARAEKFLCLWTIKESFVKFIGRGIDETFSAIDAEEILSGQSSIVGKNFFVGEAVAGVCTSRGCLPKNFILASAENFLQCAQNLRERNTFVSSPNFSTCRR